MGDEQLKHITVTAKNFAQLDLQPGQRLALRYVVMQRLHVDGSGVLYLATERATGEEVHVHVLYPKG
ncbi:hypothetical protein D777_00118 [Marinobacter nitratireducens]|uniref:Uncharacterized protein n=1 Tax=Marinobacter nitratireducens TaxID=1137280 RepID=A0A072NJ14_9GAMM|nr:hypothetical protein [Marinobacter nitratireducens]KEF33110.1 hypothetical protein D777_00118 [Marinobacter nitratireducens]